MRMPTIGFLVKTYPKLSETFILEEILGLERAAPETDALHIFSLYPPSDEFAHTVTAQVRARLTYLESDSKHLWALAWRHPLRTVRALLDVATDSTLRYRDLTRAACLARHLQIEGITHLHCHFISEPAGVAHLASVLSGCSFSISAHAKDIYLSPKESLTRRMHAARFTVTCTEHNLAYLNGIAPTGARVSRMYHGIDLGSFDGVRAATEAAPLILSVGRLKAKKGYPVLIAACRELMLRQVRFRCEIVGYGETREALQRQIDTLGLSTCVRLVGKLERGAVIDRYRQASVFALPCVVADDGDRDGIPNVLLEAMAMRLPVVSTSVSGIPEIVQHGRDGVLVPANDATALANAMQLLLRDPRLCEQLGDAARTKIASRCSNAHNLEHLRALLAGCCTPHDFTPATPRLETAHGE